MARNRNFCFTLNNYTEVDIDNLKKLDAKYIIFGKEIAPTTKTPHLQGYIEFTNAKTLKSLKKINASIHWEFRKGTANEAAIYCKKDGDYYEHGNITNQGHRTDLINICTEVKNGKKVDDIALENPVIYHQYARTLHKLEDLSFRSKFRNWMTTCDWIYGPTGTGKSHKAFDNYNPATHYLWKLNDKWQDGYCGQDIIIINDFRGEISYNELLNIIDKYPFTLPRRGREPVPLLAKHVIITCSLHPKDIYVNRNCKDKLAQLLRRVKLLNFTQKWSEGNTVLQT